MSLTVRTTERSPFGQKVITSARILGIADKLERLEADFIKADSPLRVENALGKMPVLGTESGQYIFDSRVIVEYLNDRFAGTLVPNDPEEKAQVKTVEALSDGMMDAGVLIFIESQALFRNDEQRSPAWVEHQIGKMSRGFQRLQELDLDPKEKNVGTISVGCLLRWLKKRPVYELGEQQSYFDNWLETFEESLP